MPTSAEVGNGKASELLTDGPQTTFKTRNVANLFSRLRRAASKVSDHVRSVGSPKTNLSKAFVRVTGEEPRAVAESVNLSAEYCELEEEPNRVDQYEHKLLTEKAYQQGMVATLESDLGHAKEDYAKHRAAFREFVLDRSEPEDDVATPESPAARDIRSTTGNELSQEWIAEDNADQVSPLGPTVDEGAHSTDLANTSMARNTLCGMPSAAPLQFPTSKTSNSSTCRGSLWSRVTGSTRASSRSSASSPACDPESDGTKTATHEDSDGLQKKPLDEQAAEGALVQQKEQDWRAKEEGKKEGKLEGNPDDRTEGRDARKAGLGVGKTKVKGQKRKSAKRVVKALLGGKAGILRGSAR